MKIDYDAVGIMLLGFARRMLIGKDFGASLRSRRLLHLENKGTTPARALVYG